MRVGETEFDSVFSDSDSDASSVMQLQAEKKKEG